MKVISFKVEDSIYDALRKKNVSFRVLFEPIAIQLSQNNRMETKYTHGIRKKNDGLYIDIVNIQKTIQKIIKTLEDCKDYESRDGMLHE